MKYVRTKNFIHDSKDVVVVNENGTLVVLRGIDKDFVERTRGKTWNTGTNVVLAQADTIEELCDEFVIVDNRFPKSKRFESNFDELVRWFNQCKISKVDIIIHGAIWTKGDHDEPILKSIAKMNSKGKLELI